MKETHNYIIFILVINVFSVACLSEIQASSRTSSGKLFNNLEAKTIQWDIEFSDEIGFLSFNICGPSYKGIIDSSSVCLYSHENCGFAKNYSYGIECDTSLCNGDWDDLIFGSVQTILICNRSRNLCGKTFREMRIIHNEEQILKGFQFELRSVNMDTDIWWSPVSYTSNVYDWFKHSEFTLGQSYGRNEKLIICPSKYHEGTYFMRLFVRNEIPSSEKPSYLSSSIYNDIPSNLIKPGNLCDNYSGSHICLNEETQFSSSWREISQYNTSIFFSIPIPKICPLSMGLRIFNSLLVYFLRYDFDIDEIKDTSYLGSPKLWTHFLENPLLINLNFKCEDQPSILNLVISIDKPLNSDPNSLYPNVPFDIFFTFNKEFLNFKNINSFFINDISYGFQSIFKLVCLVNDKKTTYSPCPYSPFNTFSNCIDGINLRPQPIDDHQLWNLPPYKILNVVIPFNEDLDLSSSYVSNKLGISLLREIWNPTQTILYDEINEDCYIYFTGESIAMGNQSSWEFIVSNILPTKSNILSMCLSNSESYSQSIELYLSYLDELFSNNSFTFWSWKSSEGWFQILFSDCLNSLEDFFDKEESNIEYKSNNCIDYDPEDPCCSYFPWWTECCYLRQNTKTEQEYTNLNKKMINDFCGHDKIDCASNIIEDYPQIVDPERCSIETPSEREIFLTKSKGWKKCYSKYYSKGDLIPCLENKDCLESCDLFNNTCHTNYSSILTQFLICLEEETSPEIIQLIKKGSSLPLYEFIRSFSQNICGPNNLLDFSKLPIYSKVATCGTPSGVCLLNFTTLSSITEDFPFYCRNEGICWNVDQDSWGVKNPIVDCNVRICSVNGTSDCKKQCSLCFTNESICYDSPEISQLSYETCMDSTVCILPNKSMILNISEEECNSYGECLIRDTSYDVFHEMRVFEAYCGGKQCSKNECENIGGLCEIDIYKKNFNSGFCLIPYSQEFNIGNCHDSYSHPLGCLYQNTTNCKGYLFQYEKIVSQSECLSFQGCRVPYYNTTYELDSIVTERNSSQCQCSEEHGSEENFLEWFKGRWVSGKLYPLSWIEDEYFQPNIYFNDTLFSTIQEMFNEAISEWSQLWIISETSCRVYPTINLVTDFVCICGGDSSICHQELNKLIYITLLCPLQEREIPLGNYLMITKQESITINYCFETRMFEEYYYNWNVVPSGSLSTSFLYQENPSQREIVFNNNGVRVGMVSLTSGLRISLSDKIQSFTICVRNDEIPPEGFTIPKIVIGTDSKKLLATPLIENQNSSHDSYTFCAHVPNEVQISKENVYVFFLAFLKPGWEDDDDSLSKTEYSLLVLSICFYSLSLSLCIILLIILKNSIYGMIAKKDYFNLEVIFIIFLISLLRIICFSLLAENNNIEDNTQNALVELPTFLYLFIVLEQVLFYYFQFSVEKRKLISFITFIILIFIFIIILIIFKVVKNDDPSIECRGRLVSDSPSISNSDIVRICYKSIISIASFIISILLLKLGLEAFIQMRNFREKNQHVLQGLEKYELPVLIKTIVSSFGLSLNCLSFIIYYVLDNSSPYFLLILILTEMVPLTILLASVKREVELKYSNSKNGTSTGPSTVEL